MYNLLLGRLWVHIAGAVAFTLHQCVKFEWDYQDVWIYRNLSHPIYSKRSILVIEEIKDLDRSIFHAVEIMQVVKVGEEEGSSEVKMMRAAKMVASSMMKYGYKPESGLGASLNGAIEPMQLNQQKGTIGLGYEPTFEEDHNAGVGKKIFVPKHVPMPVQEFLPEVYEFINVQGMENQFVTVIEEYYDESKEDIKTQTIRNAEPGEILQNWSIGTSLVCRKSWQCGIELCFENRRIN